MLISDVTISSSLITVDTRQLFRMLFGGALVATTRVHREGLVKVAHVLWCPKILKDVLHILVICTGIRCSTSQSSLIMHTPTMCTFDTHITEVTW